MEKESPHSSCAIGKNLFPIQPEQDEIELPFLIGLFVRLHFAS